MTESRTDLSNRVKPWEETEEQLESHVASVSGKSLLWPILLSLLVLLIIGLVYYEPGSLRMIARNFHPVILGGAVLLVLLRVILGATRLHFVSHRHLGFRKALRGQIFWDFSSNVTPSVIGGGPFAALLISRDTRLRLGEITSVMLFIMLLDQVWFAVAVLVLIFASLRFNVYPDSLGLVGSTVFTTFFVGILAWALIFGYATLVKPQILHSIVNLLTRIPFLRRFRKRADAEMQELRRRAALLRSESPAFFLKGILLTMSIWLCRYFSLMFIVWSVHAALSKTTFFFRTIAMMTGALIMPTPGGSGGIEGMYALFFNALMPRSLVAPTLLVWRSLAYYLFVGVGVFLSTQLLRRTLSKQHDQTA